MSKRIRARWTIKVMLVIVFINFGQRDSACCLQALNGTSFPENATTMTITPAMSPANETIHKPREIYLLGLFPMSGSWAGGQGQRRAVLMGFEHVNEREDVLPGYKLTLRPEPADEADTEVGPFRIHVFFLCICVCVCVGGGGGLIVCMSSIYMYPYEP